MQFIKYFSFSLVIFLVIDGIWLGLIAKNLYAQKIGHLLADKPNLIAALIFYIFFIAVLTLMVTMPAIKIGSLSNVILFSLLFGAVTYATYDLTNLATLKDWPIMVTVIDIIWGAFVTGVVSTLTFIVFK